MVDIAFEVLDELIMNIGYLFEGIVYLFMTLSNAFLPFIIGIVILGMMYAVFLMIQIKSKDSKERFLRR